MDPKAIFSSIIKDKLGNRVEIIAIKNLSGGCINHAYKVETSIGSYFIKYNPNQNLFMFESEAQGLTLIKDSGTINVPEVVGLGKVPEFVYLILEYLDSSARNKNYWDDFGEKLAKMHQMSNAYFGLNHSNFIGSLPQFNTPTESWISFFIEQRLEIQLKMAIESEKIPKSFIPKMAVLYNKLSDLMPEERPALLHGDLWSGNVMVGSKGEVVLIDPAVYFGNREAEMAFTTLFGGFDASFYDSYNQHFPLASGFEDRIDLYNLYPLLVHVNLFGGGYFNSVNQIVNRMIS
jgi:fructosamine-3-kinase